MHVVNGQLVVDAVEQAGGDVAVGLLVAAGEDEGGAPDAAARIARAEALGR